MPQPETPISNRSMLRCDRFDAKQQLYYRIEPIAHLLRRGLGKFKPVDHLENHNFIGALGQKRASAAPSKRPQVLPGITVLIPLLEEPRILHHLLHHLQRLDYPRTHLEVILILEDGDVETQTELLAAKLPRWCCVITLPKGHVKTKIRALNVALGIIRGDINGVLDTKIASEKDHLLKVTNQFALADSRLICLQVHLDFYNAHRNWLTRCFALKYTAWFQVILHGLGWHVLGLRFRLVEPA